MTKDEAGLSANSRLARPKISWPRAASFIRSSGVGLIALGISAALLASCSSSSATSGHGTKGACNQVEAVLGNGPDPSADPIGYAEAQPIPLRGISTSDAPLKAAIDDLASAYEEFFRSGGSRSAKSTVNKASKRLDAICPGATS